MYNKYADDVIVCSAIKEYTSEEVWFGKRHADCIWLVAQFSRKFTSLDHQGFWVVGKGSIGRFVSRREAYSILVSQGKAKPATQEQINNNNTPELYSEDLWR